jgi:hypothetical protein
MDAGFAKFFMPKQLDGKFHMTQSGTFCKL